MASAKRRAQEFLASYSARFDEFERAAIEVQRILHDLTKAVGVPIHAVTARAKKPSSLRGKLRRKKYDNPVREVTDLVAARVITFFGRDIDRVEQQLHTVLDVSERKSRDARRELAEDQFGYRSVHLIARLRPESVTTKSEIKRRWFEIQIRSILDHAWSEIEHEAVYKSRIDFPATTRRKFKAVAASLEVLEDALAALDAERDRMIDQYVGQFSAGGGFDDRFDVARLLAFLEQSRPTAEGWRSAESAGRPFPHGSAASAVEMMVEAKLDTPTKLDPVLASREFREVAFRFAAAEGIAVGAISHLALIVLAVGSTQPALVKTRFPEMLFSPALISALT